MNIRCQQKKTTLFSPRHSSTASTLVRDERVAPSPATTASLTPSRKCCRGFYDCLVMGSTVSHNHQPPPKHDENQTSVLAHQVSELEKELQKQKELKAMCRLRLERTQDYLRYCLQIAQDHGFLDIIINNKYNQQECSLSPTIINASTSPLTPPPVQPQTELAVVVEHAKSNGWYIKAQEIQLREMIAQGTTADIYKATWRGLDVAVKCIYPDYFSSNEHGVSFFAQEVETLSRQRHRFVLQLMGACLDPPDHGWIVTEFMSATLKEWLHGQGRRCKERTVPLPPFEERLARALEIAQAMQYLHDHKPMVIHRDLKPSNIFLDDSLHVRVADFGHARFLTQGEKALTGDMGTYVYMAPEVIRSEPYNEKCDVYSFGIILNELITGEYPYIQTDFGPFKIALDVAENKIRPALPKLEDEENGENHNIEELLNLIKLCWDEEPAKRPSFATITLTLSRGSYYWARII